jgi:16S rRNA (cytidine1402-2'-O)-methyltransferase
VSTDEDNPKQQNEVVPGCLYLVGTPIGNLWRPVSSGYGSPIGRRPDAAEDTRRTLRLLNALSFRKSLDQFSRAQPDFPGPEMADRLQAGESIAWCLTPACPASPIRVKRWSAFASTGHTRWLPSRGRSRADCPVMSALSTDRFVLRGFCRQGPTRL